MTWTREAASKGGRANTDAQYIARTNNLEAARESPAFKEAARQNGELGGRIHSGPPRRSKRGRP